MELEIRSFELPPIGTQCYVVLNHDAQRLALFDAPLEAHQTVADIMKETGYALDGLYLTHGHWDHTLDGKKIHNDGVKLHAHPGDRMLFENPAIMATFTMPGLDIPQLAIDEWLEHGDRIRIVGHDVELRHVPGHSAGSLLYWFPNDRFAISGDALFNGSIGRTDFPGCSFGQLASSIREQIYSLPDETQIYPGHGPATTVGREASTNPFVSRNGE